MIVPITTLLQKYHTTKLASVVMEYDPMGDIPDSEIITPSYVPLHQKIEFWGDPCEPGVRYKRTEFICLYGQNVNSISDSTGLKYDQIFLYIKDTEASIFGINKIHTDKMNPRNNIVLSKSRTQNFQTKDRHYCKLVYHPP